jgi:methylated-DNA-[protein]-cysteine S-methyltransferase
VWFAWSEVPAPGPIRALTVGVTDVGVALVCFGPASIARRQLQISAQRLGAEPTVDAARTEPVTTELAEYLAGRRTTFDQPVDWRLTTGDQRTVLTTLYDSVGYGKTTTYGELVVLSGAYRNEHGPGQAARRVGAIMGSNPVPVIVPCHRVLAADGLGGFGGGLETKRWLLGLEGVLPPMLDLWSS